MLRRYFGKISPLAIGNLVGHNGELVIDESTDFVYIMDGTTPGGQRILYTNVSASVGNLYGHVIPALHNTFDLGNSALRWSNLYISNSIILDNAVLTISGTNLQVNGTNVLTDLYSNAATQSANLALLTTNAATQASNLATLTTNAATQATAITSLATGANANSAAYFATNYAGNITAGNVTISGNLFVTGNITTLNYETISKTEYANSIIASGNITASGYVKANTINFGGRQQIYTADTPTQNAITIAANSANDINGFFVTEGASAGAQVYTEGGIDLTVNTAGAGGPSLNYSFGTTGILSLPYSNYIESVDTNLHFGAGDDIVIRTNAASQTGGLRSWTFGVNGNLTVPGNITISGNINPTGNAAYSLGTVDHQWKSLYVSNNTIYIGGTAVQVANGTIVIGGNAITGGASTYSNSNVASYLPTDSTITTLYSNAATQANLIANLSANITSANSAISTLTSNAATQANLISALTSNAASQSTDIANLYANASSQATDIATLYTNAGSQASSITTLNNSVITLSSTVASINAGTGFANSAQITAANAAISSLDANISAANVNISTLITNAAVQSGNISTLFANAASQSSDITTLYANAATQAANLTTLFSNAANQATDITTLYSNAATQANLITAINANILSANSVISTLTSNASTQATDITTLYSNAATQANLISAINANVSAANAQISIVQGNITSINNTLVGIVGGAFSYGNANVATYLPQYTGNLTAGNISITGNLFVTGNITTLNYETISQTEYANSIIASGNITAANYFFSNGVSILANLISNASSQATDINTLYSNAATQANLITTINANIAAANTQVYSNSNVAVYLPTYTGNVKAGNLNATTAVYANAYYWYNNGAAFSSSTYSNTSVAAYLTTYGGNISANTVTANTFSVANITTTGTAGNLTGTGYIIAGNLVANSNVYANGFYWLNNGAAFSSGASSYGNTQVAAYLTTYNGNILTSNSYGYLNGPIGANGANSGVFTTVTTTSGAAFNSNATLTTDQATVTLFNMSSTTINLGGAATNVNIGAATGNTTIANNLRASTFTATGGNITAQAANVYAGNIIANTSFYASSYLYSNGVNILTGISASSTYSNVNVAAYIPTYTGNVAAGNINLTANGNIIAGTSTNMNIRTFGIYNVLTLASVQGGYNSPPYTAQSLTGGTGTGMTATYSAVGGYISTIAVVNPGTGYQNGDVLTFPGGLGSTATLSNYNPNVVSSKSYFWTFSQYDGNVSVPGNIIMPSNSYVLGDFTNSTFAYRTVFSTTTANSSTGIYAVPNGTSTAASWQAINNSNANNASKIFMATNANTDVQLGSGINGTGTYLPLSFYNNNASQMVIYANGNVYMSNANPVTTTGNINVGNLNVLRTGAVYGNVISTGNVSVGNLITFSTGSVYGNAATATLTSAVAGVGYMGMPQNATGTTTLTISDAGKHIYITTTGQTITIPAASSVAYPIGTTIAFIGGPSATTTTIAITTDTMYLAGTGTTGSRTLAAYGMATAVKVASTTWFINGSGLT